MEKSIGKIHHGKILLEAEKDGKEFKLIKSNISLEENRFGEVHGALSHTSKYYVAWGQVGTVSPGITRLKTPSGRTPSFKSCIKKFYKMIENSDKTNFKF